MSKELTPLECVEYIRKQAYGNWLDDELDIIEKSLKALEIIKDKLYSWSKLYINTDEQRVSNVLTIYDIDNKEKKLLKEVLL